MSGRSDNYHIHIEGGQSPLSLNLREIWRYRDLIVLFTRRTMALKYKQTVSTKEAQVNNGLRKIRDKAGITKPLSTHIARHTFARRSSGSAVLSVQPFAVELLCIMSQEEFNYIYQQR